MLQLTALTSDVEGTVVWTSDNENVATVSATGLVTGVMGGVATITASVDGLTDSVTVTVSAGEKTYRHVLEQLNSLALQGTISIHQALGEEEMEQVTDLDFYWDEERYFSRESLEGEVLYNLDYYCLPGTNYLGAKVLDPATNEVAYYYYLDSYNQYISFDDYRAPFGSLSSDDLVQSDEGIVVDVDETMATEIGQYLSGYALVFQNVLIEIDENYDVTGLSVSGTSTDEDGVVTQTQVDLTVTTTEAIDLPIVEPREAQAGSEKIGALFESLRAGNYTAEVTLDNGYSSVTGTIQVDGDLYTETIDGTTEGYVQTADGVMDFVVQEGKPVGVDRTPVADSLDEVLPAFDFLPAMFDVDGNTYTLPSGYGLNNFVSNIIPVPLTSSEFSTVADDGSLTFVDNGDGTWNISYTSTLDYGFMSFVDEYEIVLSDIGTTDTGLEAADYVPVSAQSSWADVEYVEEIFAYTLGLPEGALPFWIPEGGTWSLDDYYILLRLALPEDMTAEEAIEAYGAVLLEAGWVAIGTNEYGETIYELTTADYIFDISLGMEDERTMSVSFYEPRENITYEDTALSQWLKENFSDLTALNYSIDISVDSAIYPAEIVGNEVVQTSDVPISEGNMGTAQVKATSEGFQQSFDGTIDTVVDSRVEGVSDVYSGTEEGLAFVGTLDGTWTDYLPSPNSLATINHYLETEDPDVFTSTDSSVLSYVSDICGMSVSESYVPNQATFTLDEENGTLTITYDMFDSFVYLDASNTTIGRQVVIGTLVISDIGTTTIDFDGLLADVA